MSPSDQAAWPAKEPVSGRAVTLLVLFFLASSGVFDSRPLDAASRALCLVGKSEEVEVRRVQGLDSSSEAVIGPRILAQAPIGRLAICCLVGRGMPAPRAPAWS